MIPKFVHAIWLGDRLLPAEYEKNIDGWQKVLQGYQIKVWRDNDLEGIGKDIPFVKYCRENNKYAFLSDWYRLYLIYTYGGIYIDTDVEVYKKFDDLLSSAFFLSFIVDSSLQMAIFGAEPNNSFIKDLLSHLETNFLEGLPLVANNQWVTKYFLDSFPDFKLDGREQHLKCGIDIYPKTFFDTYPSIFDFSKKGGYSVHFCAGSWIENKEGGKNTNVLRLKNKIKKIMPKFMVRQINYLSHVRQAKDYPYYSVYLDTKHKNKK